MGENNTSNSKVWKFGDVLNVTQNEHSRICLRHMKILCILQAIKLWGSNIHKSIPYIEQARFSKANLEKWSFYGIDDKQVKHWTIIPYFSVSNCLSMPNDGQWDHFSN